MRIEDEQALTDINNRINQLSAGGIDTPEEYNEYLTLMNEKVRLESQTNEQPEQKSNNQMPSLGGAGKLTDMMSSYGEGSGSSASSGSGGTFGSGIGSNGSFILAAILAQMGMADENYKNKEPFEGQRSGGVGHDPRNYTIEPWLAYLVDSPTEGEKYSAALKNEDYGTALKRAPVAGLHWTNPLNSAIYELSRDKWGEKTAGLLVPDFGLTDWLTYK